MITMFLPGESELLDVLTRVAAERDHGIGHVLRVGCYVQTTMEKMGFSREDIERAAVIARIHDIGNANIRDEILRKYGQLTNEERLEVSQHPVAGGEKFGKIFEEFLYVIRHHHENWDGSGYPNHLAGERIPVWARILRVADAFDAMTSWRPYRPNPLTVDEAIQKLRMKAGIEFDPKVVSVFADQLDTVRAVAQWIDDCTPLHHGSCLAIEFRVISGGTDPEFTKHYGVVDMLRELSCRYFRGYVYIYPNSTTESNDHKQHRWLSSHHVFERAHISTVSLDYYMLDVAEACSDMKISHFIGYDPETVAKLVRIVPNLYLLSRDPQSIPSGSPIKATSSTQQLIDWIIRPWPMEIPLERLAQLQPTA